MKYYLIINEEDWEYGGEEVGSYCVSRAVAKEFDSLEEAKKAQPRAYNDSLLIKGELLEGELTNF